MSDMVTSQELNLLRSLIMSLEARVCKIDAQIETMDDDYGEADMPIIQAQGGASGYWNGKAIDFFGTLLLSIDVTDATKILGKYIVFHCGLSPTKHASATWPSGASSGAWAWDTELRGAPWMSWEVAEAIPDTSPTEYRLIANKTVGTIRLPIPVATSAYHILQVGAETGTTTTNGDNGILFKHARAISS